QNVRPFRACAAFAHTGCELAANQFGEPHPLPLAAAKQGMSIGHRLNTTVEYLEKLLHGAAALSGALRNRGDGREHVLDAVVELADQQALAFLGPLALGDVAGQSLEA